MMIPPVIRMGSPPCKTKMDLDLHYIVLTKNGWSTAMWHHPGMLSDCDRHMPDNARAIRAEDVLCWMPEDGS